MNTQPQLQSLLSEKARQKCIASRNLRSYSYADRIRNAPKPKSYEEALHLLDHYYKLSTHYHYELGDIAHHKLTPTINKLTIANEKLTKGGSKKALLYKARKEVFVKEVDKFHKENGRFPTPKNELLKILEMNHPAPDDYKQVKGKNGLMPYWCLDTITTWLKKYKRGVVL